MRSSKIEPKTILVRMPNWIGDLVMATPVLTRLRRAYPDAEIVAMVRGSGSALLSFDPDINSCLHFNRASPFWHSIFRRDIIAKLRESTFDLAIILPNSFSSAWYCFMAGIPKRLGFSGHFLRRFLLTKAMPYPKNIKDQHLTKTYLALLDGYGIKESGEEKIRLYIKEEEIFTAKELLKDLGIKKEQKIIGINPGAAYGMAKCWPKERFASVARALVQEGHAVLFFGDAKGSDLVNEICADLPAGIFNLSGRTTLRELAALLSLCTVVLTNDSGPMHMASALGTPLVAIFGSTSAVVTGPYNKESAQIIYKNVPCSPCFKRKCPYNHFDCMMKISEKEVLSALRKVLDV